VPDNSDVPAEKTSRFSRRPRKVSAVSREVVLGLDKIERTVSLVGGAIAMVLAAYEIPDLLHNRHIIETAKYVKGKTCATGYKHVAAQCQKSVLVHPSYWLPQFLLIVVFGLGIILFALLRKRVGVVTTALVLWLALSTAGLPFLFVAGWLIMRAFRLQKYGDASFSGSNRRAKEIAKERRASGTPARTKSRSKTTVTDGVLVPGRAAPPTASKRYTPKQKPRKR